MVAAAAVENTLRIQLKQRVLALGAKMGEHLGAVDCVIAGGGVTDNKTCVVTDNPVDKQQ